jgi:hypothetical protein
MRAGWCGPWQRALEEVTSVTRTLAESLACSLNAGALAGGDIALP